MTPSKVRIFFLMPFVSLLVLAANGSADVTSVSLGASYYTLDDSFVFEGTESVGQQSVFVIIRGSDGGFLGMVSDHYEVGDVKCILACSIEGQHLVGPARSVQVTIRGVRPGWLTARSHTTLRRDGAHFRCRAWAHQNSRALPSRSFRSSPGRLQCHTSGCYPVHRVAKPTVLNAGHPSPAHPATSPSTKSADGGPKQPSPACGGSSRLCLAS